SQHVDQIGTREIGVAGDGAHELLIKPELYQHAEQQAERHRQVEGSEAGGSKPTTKHGGGHEGSGPGNQLSNKHDRRLAHGISQQTHADLPPTDFGFWILDFGLPSTPKSATANAGMRASTPSMQPRKIIERE